MRIGIPGPNDCSHIRDKFEAANAYRFPSEVPTKTDSPGCRAGAELSVGSDQTAIDVTLPANDRVTTSDPPGRAVSPSNSTKLSFSAYKVPSAVPTYTTKSRCNGSVLLPKFTPTGPAVISAGVVKAAV